MKTIGLLGGMSWESTVVYYQLLNRMVREELGGLHSAKVLMDSYDFTDIVNCQLAGDWDKAARIMVNSAKNLERSGADMILICANTMHILADTIQNEISIPLLNIVDVVAEQAQKMGIHSLGLLGTLYTMERPFYSERLAKHGIDTVVPGKNERQMIHDVIFNELCQGRVLNASRQAYIRVIERMREQGVEGIILGCTEIPLLIEPQHVTAPLLDTTYLHAQKAVQIALEHHTHLKAQESVKE